MEGIGPNSQSFKASCAVKKTKWEGIYIFELKTTLLAGQRLGKQNLVKFA